MWLYYLIFFIIVFLYFLGKELKLKYVTYPLSFFIILLVTVFRPESAVKDYGIYKWYYYLLDSLTLVDIEPSFFIISYISKYSIGSPIGMFIIYACIALGLKYYAFKRISKDYDILLITYFPFYFIIHEMTQIRVAVATSILMFAIPYIYEKKMNFFLLLIVLGSFFHYSFLLFGMFYFIDSHRLNRFHYFSILLVGYLLAIIKIDILDIIGNIDIEYIYNKFSVHKAMIEDGSTDEVNIFNSLTLLKIVLCSFFIFQSNKLNNYNPYAIILIKIWVFSFFFYVVLSPIPVLAFRISEMFGVVEVVVLSMLIYLISPRFIPILALIAYGVLLLILELHFQKLMNPYF